MAKAASPNKGSKEPLQMPPPVAGLKSIEIISKIFLLVIMKFWALCTTALLMILLFYWLYGGLAALILLITAVIGFLYNTQDKLLYYPEQPSSARIYVESPAVLNLPFENIWTKTQDGYMINMYLIKQPPLQFNKAPTALFLHGNAGNIGHRLLNAHALWTYCGFNILLVEYRGYGKSQGSPSEQGLYKDAQAAFSYLIQRSDIDSSKIILYGRSLGGAVAIQIANHPTFAPRTMCLLVENTFTSLPEIGKHIFDFRILAFLPNWLFKNKYPSRQRIQKVLTPTLFMSGQADNLIPPRMMSELYQASGSMLKRLAKFEGGNHNDTWQCNGYYECINRFLAEVAQCQDLNPPQASGTYRMMDIPFHDGAVFTL